MQTSLPPEELRELIVKAKEGDHAAFGRMYDAFIIPVYRYVAFRVDGSLVEDLVADTFVKAWEHLHRYREWKGIPFSAWLFRIARNTVIDSFRSAKETVELDEFQEDQNRWNDPQTNITLELKSVVLRQAIDKLPRKYREVLLLSYMSELSTEEVARTLKMREGGVRVMKHRALQKLQTLLPVSMRDEL